MKPTPALLSLLLALSLLLPSCAPTPPNAHESETTTIIPLETDLLRPDAPSLGDTELAALRAAMPKTDGSTSTLPLDIAAHSALLGLSEEEARAAVKHTKTYTSLQNLVDGSCELIIRTPLSAAERLFLSENRFTPEEKPVSSEGFVFVVNHQNPIDTLTEDQLRAIYSGKITNWKEVGGDDLPIIPYQRNADSGSQNYMLAFMGDTPLMDPITEPLPATMAGILDAIAGYDNAAGAIGYSVYAYSDGMYEDMAKIKYIKVNGVEPSLTTIADGSYPLIDYNYALFDSTLPADAPARLFAAWLQSNEGQRVIASAGYVPYRQIEGLALPEAPSSLYQAVGSGAPSSDADFYYTVENLRADTFPTLADHKVNAIIQDYLKAEQARLETLKGEPYETLQARLRTDEQGGMASEPHIRLSILNGYLSILSGIPYYYGTQDSPYFYDSAKTAVFDLYTGKQLALSDLFPKDSDFLPTLNAYLAKEANAPYSGFGSLYPMIKEFTALLEGEFTFTADSILFTPGKTFAEGTVLSLEPIRSLMSVSSPRDMQGLFASDDVDVRKVIPAVYKNRLGGAEQYQNGNSQTTSDSITLWLLDADKSGLSPAVCETINSYLRSFYHDRLAPEKLLALAEANGINQEDIKTYGIGPWGDNILTLYGRRYLQLAGPNLLMITKQDGTAAECTLFDTKDEYPFYYYFYFDAQTGELLKPDAIFTEGWEDASAVTHADSSGEQSAKAFFAAHQDYTITAVRDYERVPNRTGTKADSEVPVTVFLLADDILYTLSVPRTFIP